MPAAAVWLETPLAGLWSDNNMLLGSDESQRELVFTTDEANVTSQELADSLAVSSLLDLNPAYGAGVGADPGAGLLG